VELTGDLFIVMSVVPSNFANLGLKAAKKDYASLKGTLAERKGSVRFTSLLT
jgi:hypothetical protein